MEYKRIWFMGILLITLAFHPERAMTPRPLSSPLPIGPSAMPALSLSFVGDIMAHNVNYNIPSYEEIYSRVEGILLNDDLSFANLEFPVNSAQAYSTYPRFNVKLDYVQAAIHGGMDVFSLSNNHSMDQGKNSALFTLKELDSLSGITYSGIRREVSEGMKTELMLKNGWRIGFLSITTFLNYREGRESVYLVNYRNKVAREEFLYYIQCAVRYYDFFVLSVHAGKEYSLVADERKMDFFRDLSDAGVDIVWGHHPHVLQAPEFRIREKGRALILPSCGNFISGQPWYVDPVHPDKWAYTGDSAIFRIEVEKAGTQVNVRNLQALPISHYKDPERGMITDYTQNLSISPDIPEEWRRFYKARLVSIKESLSTH